MGKHHLRKDTTCQNCGHTVTARFCSNCGQENTETRQSFAHLVRHFAEDVTHYDSNFWLTMRYLLFRPGYLTKEFLKGKRNRYVPPVRLYIFISFLTFFLPYVLPDLGDDVPEHTPAAPIEQVAAERTANDISYSDGEIHIPHRYRSIKQLDSTELALPESERMGWYEYWLEKKYININKYNGHQLTEKFRESFYHNIPKGLFIYMPLFAMILWLFHTKKRWFYFDHAIFTLHYFSFMLLFFNLLYLSSEIMVYIDPVFFESIQEEIAVLFLLAYLVYFVVALKKTYEQKWINVILKSLIIYFLNSLLFFTLLIGLGIYTVLMIH